MRTFIAWLYRRFPPQLVISAQEYQELRQELAQYNLAVQAITELNNRLVVLEAQVGRLNDSNGFVAQGKGSFKLER